MKINFLTPPPLDENPPTERIFGCNYGLYSQPNIFVLYPATVLKNAGYNVKVTDLVVENYNENKFLKYITNDDSDIYIFYTVFLSKKTDLLAKEKIRKLRKGVKFIYIGTEPTANPKDFIDKNDVIVIRGESEETILELIKALAKNKKIDDIKGISYFSKKIINNLPRLPIENLDKLPIPDRTLINTEKYYNPKFPNPFTIMLTSRGCFGQCYYCVPCSLSFAREIEYKKQFGYKPKPRQRSAENIIRELKLLHKQGYKSIYFVDDQFVWWDKKRMIKIMKVLKDYGFRWGALSRADMLLNEDVIKEMAETNCDFIDIGIESFNQKILDDIKKGEKVEAYYKAISLLKKYGIEPEINVLLAASPLETKETIKKTLDEIKKLGCKYVLVSICTPFPHTRFYDIAKKKGWMTGEDYQPLDPIRNAQISYPHLTKEELEEIIKNAYKEFYFRPKYMFKQLLEIRSFNELVNKLKVALKIAKM
ncbi:MAG: B12-binding domain-containing radical SAM protein [Spirochaetota bacterium]|nr:B12-binding domain-containing radical SAM protein [Spirochaetota bacterium]